MDISKQFGTNSIDSNIQFKQKLLLEFFNFNSKNCFYYFFTRMSIFRISSFFLDNRVSKSCLMLITVETNYANGRLRVCFINHD